MDEHVNAPSLSSSCRHDEVAAVSIRDFLKDRPELLQRFDQQQRRVGERGIEVGCAVPDPNVHNGGRPEPGTSEVMECLRHRQVHPMLTTTGHLQPCSSEQLLRELAEGALPLGHVRATYVLA